MVNSDRSTNGITNGINNLLVDQRPRARSKNLDVLAEYEKKDRKNTANFVVIGAHPRYCDLVTMFSLMSLRPRGSREEHAHGTTSP